MTGPLVAGVDCSTQATKVRIVDADTGRVVGSGMAPHRVLGQEGVRETDPGEWWRALGEALAQTERAGEVSAIAVAGQQHALVLLDRRGQPVRAAPLWNDTTSAEAATDLVRALGGKAACARRIGSVLNSSFTVTSWCHLRRGRDAAVIDAVEAVRLPHDFLTERLCGRGVTDRGDASGTGWWSPIREAYDGEILALDAVGLDPSLLPEVLKAGDPAGVAGDGFDPASLGLSDGVVVAAGSGDNMAAAVGLGLLPGTPVMSLGTSGTIFALADRATSDASGTVAGFADAGTGFLPLACTLNATLAVDRVAAWLGLDREQVAPAGGVVMLPYLDGERTPGYPAAAGSLLGLRHETRPEQILQSAYDGVIEGLLAALDRLEAMTGGLDPTAPLVLVGGGSGGAAWQQTAARLSGRRVELPGTTELVATGAAALAAAALSREDAALIARRWATGREPQTLAAPERDEERLARMRRVRSQLASFNERP